MLSLNYCAKDGKTLAQTQGITVFFHAKIQRKDVKQ